MRTKTGKVIYVGLCHIIGGRAETLEMHVLASFLKADERKQVSVQFSSVTQSCPTLRGRLASESFGMFVKN